jgi:hypothetical protein
MLNLMKALLSAGWRSASYDDRGTSQKEDLSVFLPAPVSTEARLWDSGGEAAPDLTTTSYLLTACVEQLHTTSGLEGFASVSWRMQSLRLFNFFLT